MALHNGTTTLRSSVCSIAQFLILIGAQVLVAVIMTVIANKFDIRYLSDATILLWIVLAIVFCLVSSSVIVIKLCLSVFSFFVSTGVYSVLLYIYKARS